MKMEEHLSKAEDFFYSWPYPPKAQEGEELQYWQECNSFFCWVFWRSNASGHAEFDAHSRVKPEGIWGIKPKTLNLLFVKKSLCRCLIDGVLEAPNRIQNQDLRDIQAMMRDLSNIGEIWILDKLHRNQKLCYNAGLEEGW